MADRADPRLVADQGQAAALRALTAGITAARAAPPDAGLIPQPIPSYPELDCVRHLLTPAALAAVERRSRALGVTADHVLLAGGFIDEETYVRALADRLGLRFEPLNTVPRAQCPLDDARLIDAQAVGLLPLAADDDDAFTLVIAPRGVAARRLFTLVQASPELRRRARLTTEQRLRQYIDGHDGGKALGERAAFALYAKAPALSAAPRHGHERWLKWAAGAVLLVLAAALPDLTMAVASVALAATFLAWTSLRLLGAATAPSSVKAVPRRPAESLPVFTIIVALYHEAGAVRSLVASLDRLDWPPEKLDVKMVLEPDDDETRAALEALPLRRPYEILTAPGIGPRTKPKALNVALPFARGTFVTVFDAEDRPEPDQLRHAYEAFVAAGDRLACVQARLTIDNTDDTWLTGMFTAEYAGLFDVLLPALARSKLPLPLGGSSNYFRTAVLRAVGGWDPYNLTEDADLGIRLARYRYRSTVIASSTYEEAPAALAPWLRQRRRWFQGWMQTWLVHMRTPRRTWRELGPAGFLTLQLVVGGTVLSALVHPLFLIGFAVSAAAGEVLDSHGFLGLMITWLSGTTFVSGYLATAVLGFVGLARRRLKSRAWVLLLVPLHWLLLSLAAWRAVIKLLRDPYRWDKTEHGCAATSRSAQAARAAAMSQPTGGHIAAGNIRLSSATTGPA